MKTNPKEVRQLIKRIANDGIVDAQCCLYKYYKNDKPDNTKNNDKYFYWLKRASKNGDIDSLVYFLSELENKNDMVQNFYYNIVLRKKLISNMTHYYYMMNMEHYMKIHFEDNLLKIDHEMSQVIDAKFEKLINKMIVKSQLLIIKYKYHSENVNHQAIKICEQIESCCIRIIDIYNRLCSRYNLFFMLTLFNFSELTRNNNSQHSKNYYFGKHKFITFGKSNIRFADSIANYKLYLETIESDIYLLDNKTELQSVFAKIMKCYQMIYDKIIVEKNIRNDHFQKKYYSTE